MSAGLRPGADAEAAIAAAGLPHLPVRRASTRRERLVGLAFRRRPPGHALLLERCRSVHTFGMRYRLDLHWIDRSGRPVRVDRAVAPCRIRSCRRAFSVVEVPSFPQRGAGASGYTFPP